MENETRDDTVKLRILRRALRDTRDQIDRLETEEEELMVEIAKLEKETADGK